METKTLIDSSMGAMGVVIGSLCTFFGIKYRICNLEKNVVFKDVFSQFEKRYNADIKDVKDMLKELRDKTK